MNLAILVIFNLSKTLFMYLSVGKPSFASSQPSQTLIPNSYNLDALCAYKGAINFLDLLILRIVPRDPPIFLILGCVKILLSPMQYF